MITLQLIQTFMNEIIIRVSEKINQNVRLLLPVSIFQKKKKIKALRFSEIVHA